MDFKITYLFIPMAILGVLSGLYHLFYGAYPTMSAIAIVVSIAVAVVSYTLEKKDKDTA